MKARRYELTDKEWELIRLLIPISHTGRPQKDILMLVMKYHESNCKDKSILGTIDRAIDSSIQLRSKKDLIHGFINTVNAATDVDRDWQSYPILFYKNQHYGAVMLYGHVHNTREWKLVEKWKNEQWAMGIPSRLINVGCMMDYMRYTPRTLTELLDANPMPEIARDRKDGSAVESAEQQNKRERTWDLNEGYTAEKTE